MLNSATQYHKKMEDAHTCGSPKFLLLEMPFLVGISFRLRSSRLRSTYLKWPRFIVQMEIYDMSRLPANDCGDIRPKAATSVFFYDKHVQVRGFEQSVGWILTWELHAVVANGIMNQGLASHQCISFDVYLGCDHHIHHDAIISIFLLKNQILLRIHLNIRKDSQTARDSQK